MNKRLTIQLILACAAASSPICAQQVYESDSITVVRPVTAAYTVEVGTSRIADTYLSPIKYSGWGASLRYERLQAMKFNPEHWIMQLSVSANVERAQNRVGNATMWYCGLDFNWSMMRRYRPTAGLMLAAGGRIEAEVGCLYLARNGNNPASAKAAVTLGITGIAAYSMNIGRLPVTFAWQPAMPFIGTFFSPDYGELYYEIYLGDHGGLAHLATPDKYFKLDNIVTADLHFGATSLRLGYHGSIISTKVNHIVSNHFTHCAVIGVSGEWISLNPRKPLSKRAKVISALFNN